MAAARRRQQRWAAERNVCSGDAGQLNPPPYAKIGKGEECLAAPNKRSDGGDKPPCALEGYLTPGGGEECLVVRRQQRSYSAGHFLPGVEAQLRLFVTSTLTCFCCCCIALSGLISTTTINDDALIECTWQEG